MRDADTKDVTVPDIIICDPGDLAELLALLNDPDGWDDPLPEVRP